MIFVTEATTQIFNTMKQDKLNFQLALLNCPSITIFNYKNPFESILILLKQLTSELMLYRKVSIYLENVFVEINNI